MSIGIYAFNNLIIDRMKTLSYLLKIPLLCSLGFFVSCISEDKYEVPEPEFYLEKPVEADVLAGTIQKAIG